MIPPEIAAHGAVEGDVTRLRQSPRNIATLNQKGGVKSVAQTGNLAGRKTRMNTHILNSPSELFLGSDVATALAQGARRFSSAAKAVRFAMEQAAPVSLHGAMLKIDGQTLGPDQIRSLHQQMETIGQARRTHQ